MPVGIRFVCCDDFPSLAVGHAVATDVELGLPWAEDSAKTSFTFEGPAEDPRFERYDVLHQVDRDVDAFYRKEPVTHIVENRRFKAFYNRDASYFLVNATERDATGVFGRLSKADPPIHGTSEEIDLSKVLALGKTTGGYFGRLRIDKVRTAAVFGDTTVVESDEWEHLAALGQLSVLYMRIVGDDDGVARSLMLMKDRSVVLMKDDGERLNLGFLSELQTDIYGLLNGAV